MTHKPADATTRPRVNALGVGVHAIDITGAVQELGHALNAGYKGYVCVTGVHGVIEAQHDSDLLDILDNAILVTPDGMPLVWLGKIQGHKNMDRVFGPDLMLAVCRMGVQTSASHFLYGGKPGVAEELKVSLERMVPGIRVVGTFTPPFRKLDSGEKADFTRFISKLKPDIIWVGLSTPKQEKFMAEYLPVLETRLMIGVGAAFDFHTGRIKDSPEWVKLCGMQWFHRMLQEPSRLWKRYLFSNSEFLIKIAAQLIGFRRYPLRSHKHQHVVSRSL